MTTERPLTVTANITKQRISDLLCCAFEGGSNYWYQITKFIKPPKLEFRSDDKTIFRHLDYPLNKGGALMIGDDDDPKHNPTRLDLDAIQNGLQLMADKYPSHYADFIMENEDASTGDVFLQLCLFGDVIYG